MNTMKEQIDQSTKAIQAFAARHDLTIAERVHILRTSATVATRAADDLINPPPKATSNV